MGITILPWLGTSVNGTYAIIYVICNKINGICQKSDVGYFYFLGSLKLIVMG